MTRRIIALVLFISLNPAMSSGSESEVAEEHLYKNINGYGKPVLVLNRSTGAQSIWQKMSAGEKAPLSTSSEILIIKARSLAPTGAEANCSFSISDESGKVLSSSVIVSPVDSDSHQVGFKKQSIGEEKTEYFLNQNSSKARLIMSSSTDCAYQVKEFVHDPVLRERNHPLGESALAYQENLRVRIAEAMAGESQRSYASGPSSTARGPASIANENRYELEEAKLTASTYGLYYQVSNERPIEIHRQDPQDIDVYWTELGVQFIQRRDANGPWYEINPQLRLSETHGDVVGIQGAIESSPGFLGASLVAETDLAFQRQQIEEQRADQGMGRLDLTALVRTPSVSGWSQALRTTLFAQEYSDATLLTDPDPKFFNPWQQTHPYGFRVSEYISYKPFLDAKSAFFLSLTSNPFNEDIFLDHAHADLSWAQLLTPTTDFSLAFYGTHFFLDERRIQSISETGLQGQVHFYESRYKNEGLMLMAGVDYRIEAEEIQGRLGLEWMVKNGDSFLQNSRVDRYEFQELRDTLTQ